MLALNQIIHPNNNRVDATEVYRLVEGGKAEVYTVVIILAIALVYTDSHNTMATTV
jgi:hypothetical protein